MKILKVKKVYIFFSATVAFMLHLPFAFSGIKSFSYKKFPFTTNSSSKFSTDNKFSSSNIYDSLKLNICGLSEHAFNYAIKGYEYLCSSWVAPRASAPRPKRMRAFFVFF